MQVVHARCCGVDVHKKTVVACVLLTEERGHVEREVRTFGTMTADLVALSDWLTERGVTYVAMESTGVYWRPVFNLLEDEARTLVLVNPQHIKAVPGRKTDVKDSEWLADLLRHGLVQPSFIPPAPIRELRELTRHRKALIQQRTRHRSIGWRRCWKVLTSSWQPSRRACWARVCATCSTPCSPARRTSPCWQSWRAGGCGPSAPRSAKP